MNLDIESYIKELEDIAKDLVDNIYKSCRLINANFNANFRSLIQFLQTQKNAKMSSSEINSIFVTEKSYIRQSFKGFCNPKRKQLRTKIIN